MNFNDLGDLVKSKYQQYVQHPSEDIGRKLAEKFPVYQQKISQDLAVNNDISSKYGVGTQAGYLLSGATGNPAGAVRDWLQEKGLPGQVMAGALSDMRTNNPQYQTNLKLANGRPLTQQEIKSTKEEGIQFVAGMATPLNNKGVYPLKALQTEAKKYGSAEEFVRAQDNDLYKDISAKWGGDDFRKYLNDQEFIEGMKKIVKTHSEPVTNFRKVGTTKPELDYKSILKYKGAFEPNENAFIKSRQDAISWIKEKKPEQLQEILKEFEYAEKLHKIRLEKEKQYVPFAIGYNGETALRGGITERPLSVTYAGDSPYEGQSIVAQFGKNTGYVYINKNAKVLPIRDTKYSNYEKELVIPIGSKIENIEVGYSGFGTKQFNTYVDVPENITKSQLTNIYNQSTKKK